MLDRVVLVMAKHKMDLGGQKRSKTGQNGRFCKDGANLYTNCGQKSICEYNKKIFFKFFTKQKFKKAINLVDDVCIVVLKSMHYQQRIVNSPDISGSEGSQGCQLASNSIGFGFLVNSELLEQRREDTILC